MGTLITCVACNGSGTNSKGQACRPCAANRRQLRRDHLLHALATLFDEHYQQGQTPPSKQRVLAVVEWAYAPDVLYAAGWRADGELSMFAGPVDNLAEMLDTVPPSDHPDEGHAYIVELVRDPETRGRIMAPVARWYGGEWQQKQGRNCTSGATGNTRRPTCVKCTWKNAPSA